MTSKDYNIITVDLTKVDSTSDPIMEELAKLKFDLSCPTILIAECLMVYIPRKITMNFLNVFTSNFKNLVFTFYDLINPHDPFGLEMLENLKIRNIKLNGIEETDSVEKQLSRLKELGFGVSECFDMNNFYNKHIDEKEKKRIEKLELFDEFEEFVLLQSHSCYGLGIKVETDYSCLNNILV